MTDKKPPARIIMTAWGDPYVQQILRFTLPALIAPGNLPVLAEHFDCELVLVTEEKHFETFRQAAAFQAAEEFCRIRFVANDHILTLEHYGAILTFSLWCGFSDLGESVTDCYLIFLNSDFVLADGSYRVMVDKMLAGERLIHAPSYCTRDMGVMATLGSRLDSRTGALSVPPREMAAMILENLHGTPRAKIVNQNSWSIDWAEQFYWYVDRHTLLGRQMPSAIVCMKPVQFRPEPISFWDYATVSVLCPGVEPCVLGDSDDFLMLELRPETTYMAQTHMGWNTPAEIAAALDTFSTRDQLHYGRYPLVLHSKDIPDTVDAAERQLNEFMESVFEHLAPEPISPENHPFWGRLPEDTLQYLIGSHRDELVGGTDKSATAEQPGVDTAPSNVLRRISAEIKSGLRRRLGPLFYRVMGKVPFLTPWHPFWGCYYLGNEIVAKELRDRAPKNILVVYGGAQSFLTLVIAREGYSSKAIRFTDIFMETPNYAEVRDGQKFDFCVCELGYTDLSIFGNTYENYIRPMMHTDACIVANYSNLPHKEIVRRNTDFAQTAFPTVDAHKTYYAGGRKFWMRDKILEATMGFFAATPRKPWLAVPAFLCLIWMIISARLVNATIARRHGRKVPSGCTSITTVIEVLPDYRPPSGKPVSQPVGT